MGFREEQSLVEVKVNDLGHWGLGTRFPTSNEHAAQLEAAGKVRVIRRGAGPTENTMAEGPEEVKEPAVDEEPEPEPGELEWPDLLTEEMIDQVLDTIDDIEDAAGFAAWVVGTSPQQVARRIDGVGPKNAVKLLAWAKTVATEDTEPEQLVVA